MLILRFIVQKYDFPLNCGLPFQDFVINRQTDKTEGNQKLSSKQYL